MGLRLKIMVFRLEWLASFEYLFGIPYTKLFSIARRYKMLCKIPHVFSFHMTRTIWVYSFRANIYVNWFGTLDHNDQESKQRKPIDKSVGKSTRPEMANHCHFGWYAPSQKWYINADCSSAIDWGLQPASSTTLDLWTQEIHM